MASLNRSRPPVLNEFLGADLGDMRRRRRLEAIVTRLAARPDVGFPRAMDDEADLQGFYRFLRNDAVTFDALLTPHVKATLGRCAGRGEVLAIHDTTEFRFTSAREGLGRLLKSGHGFLGHFTLAVTADGSRQPLGMLAIEAWARRGPTPTSLLKQKKMSYAEVRALPSEQDRWLRAVKEAEEVASPFVDVVHVMDSEADDYSLMSSLVTAGHRWVLRLCYNRRLDGAEEGTHTKEFLARRPVSCTQAVHLTRHRRQPGAWKTKRKLPRTERDATLAISAAQLAFRRPSYATENPEALTVNVVMVREMDPPEGEAPVEWILLTTEPIETQADMMRVVDFYRARWVIEEFFKALKTGCSFEKRQLESLETLRKGLGLLVPIAWGLMRLRTVARTDADAPATTVLSATQIKVLRKALKKPLPRNLTARDALLAIAKLAGHHRSNGDPGWLLLGRGYQDLLMMVAGYRLASGEM